MKTGIVSALFLIIFVARAYASPADTEAQARQRFEHGQRLLESQKYVEALAEFSAGYELSQKPLFLFNMGECARSMGDGARARQNYERYLAADPNGKLSEKARERLAELGGPTESKPAPVVAPAAPVASPPPVSATTTVAATPATAPAAGVARQDLVASAPLVAPKPVWKRTGFWVGISVGAAAIIAASAVGGYYGSQASTGCATNCGTFR